MQYNKGLICLFSISVFLFSDFSVLAEKPLQKEEKDGVTVEKFKSYQKISTNGFSFSLASQWHVEFQGNTILAGTHGEQAPFIILDYSLLSPSPSLQNIEDFKDFQKSSTLRSNLHFDVEKDIRESAWHKGIENKNINNYLSVEMLDIEHTVIDDVKTSASDNNQTLTLDQKRVAEKKNLVPICNFLREYHAPKAEVYFAVILSGTCMAARPEFEAIEKSFIWKE